MVEKEYKNGEVDGFYKMCESTGNVLRYIEMKNGTFHGKTIFYLDGEVIAEADLQNGWLHVYFIEYYPHSTQIKIQCDYLFGKVSGDQKLYSPEGKLISSKLTNNKDRYKLTLETIYNENGNETGLRRIDELPRSHSYFLGFEVHQHGTLTFQREDKK